MKLFGKRSPEEVLQDSEHLMEFFPQVPIVPAFVAAIQLAIEESVTNGCDCDVCCSMRTIVEAM